MSILGKRVLIAVVRGALFVSAILTILIGGPYIGNIVATYMHFSIMGTIAVSLIVMGACMLTLIPYVESLDVSLKRIERSLRLSS